MIHHDFETGSSGRRVLLRPLAGQMRISGYWYAAYNWHLCIRLVDRLQKFPPATEDPMANGDKGNGIAFVGSYWVAASALPHPCSGIQRMRQNILTAASCP